MKSIIVVAKNIEQAIEKGLTELNTEFENVDINVINEGGLFKKAKIEMTLSDVSAIKEEILNSAKIKLKENKVSTLQNSKNKAKQETAKQTKTKIDETKVLEELAANNKENVLKPATNESVLATDKDFSKELKEIESQLKEFEKTEKTSKQEEIEKVENLVKEFLEGLIYSFSVVATVETEYKSGALNVRIVGDNLGFLIGYRGESLESIQYLINNLVINRLRSRIRVLLDIENYKKKREESLKKMATKIAGRVQEHKKSLKLEPMSSYERKVIHTHLQTFENIQTYSEGKDPKRHLVIKYKEN